MSTAKIIYIAVAVVLVIIAGVFIFVFKGNSGQVSVGNNSAESASSQISKIMNIPQGDTLSIGTARGTVGVKNFYKNALGAREQFIIIGKSENYEINYDAYTSGFSIYVSAAPFDSNRSAAEKAFLDVLGIGGADVCKLKVFESVSPDVDKNLAGRNLGLSFCGGGV